MLKNKKGIALAISFLVIVVLLILGSVFILRSMGEKKAADKERKSIQAFYLAEAGANEALGRLDTLINTDLMQTVNGTNPQVLANRVEGYVSVNDSLALLLSFTKENGIQQFTCPTVCASTCPLNCNMAIYNSGTPSGTPTNLGQGNYQYVVTITKNGNPITIKAHETWDFPFNFKITSTGTAVGTPRKIISSGDFTVRVQHDNFAKYALFDAHHTDPGGGRVWFTIRTNFSGPVHTNDGFRFYGDPNSVPPGRSGTFDGAVTQHQPKAEFYDDGPPYVQLDADRNDDKDVPVFNEGYTRGVAEINLESSVTQDDLKNQAQGGVGGSYSNGIYVNNDGSNVLGGIYVKGNATVTMDKQGTDKATYNITQGGTTKIITVDYTLGKTTVQTVGGATNVYNGKPDGLDNLGNIIYVDGTIDSLSGTVQKDSQVTVSSQSDIVITNNITYEDYNSGPPPSAEGKTNLLGILSWGGNVRVGTGAPQDITIHGTVMARNGVFKVDDYDSRCYPNGCGIATLLGGAITDFYGAFGTFDSQNGHQLTGYGRNFVYDQRMAEGQAPPYFPSMKTFVAYTTDITDKLTWQEGGI